MSSEERDTQEPDAAPENTAPATETPKVSEPAPKPKPVSRAGRSFSVIAQVIMFTLVIIALNYLSCAQHKRIDLTQRRDFTLSDTTKKYLHSEPVTSRKEPVHIIAVMRRSSPHFSRIQNLLDEYKRIANGALTVELIDPVRQTDRTLELESAYKIPYTEDMLIIDGRSGLGDNSTDDKPNNPTPPTGEQGPSPDTEAAQAAKAASTTDTKDFSAHVRTLYVKHLYLQDLDQFRNLYISAWQDEDVVTSGIRGAVEGKPRKFYFAADKSNLEAADGNPAWKIYADLLWRQNIHLQPIRLSDIDTIPDDAEGFALIAPQHDLNEREEKILSEYWDRPSSSVMITLDPRTKLNRLRIFLRNYGVTPRYDRIITVQDGQRLSNTRATFTRGPEVNKDLGGNSTIFDGVSSSLEIRENDDQLLNKRIFPMALVQAADGWWGETRYQLAEAEYNKEEDYAGPLYLSAAVIRGQASSDDTAQLVSKMMIISNSDFLSADNMRSEQADFVQSGVNWLVGREDLIGVGARKSHRHKITLLDSHSSYIGKIVLFFLPATAIFLALVIWNTRRA